MVPALSVLFSTDLCLKYFECLLRARHCSYVLGQQWAKQTEILALVELGHLSGEIYTIITDINSFLVCS